MPDIDIETTPLRLTDALGNEVLTFRARTTAAGTKQAQIKRGDLIVATIGHDEAIRDAYVQFFGEEDKPPVSIVPTRDPSGVYGDIWAQASVTIGTVEACTRDADPTQFGMDGVAVKADPNGAINLCRQYLQGGNHAAAIRLFQGAIQDPDDPANNVPPKEAARIGHAGGDSLTFSMGHHVSAPWVYLLRCASNWVKMRMTSSTGSTDISADNDGKLKAVTPAGGGTVKQLAP